MIPLRKRKLRKNWLRFSLEKKLLITRPDEELAALASRGNRDAFAILYDRYFDPLVLFAGRYLKDHDTAQDAIQEVFYKLMLQLSTFDSARRFSTWVYQVAKNHCLNHVRNEENRARLRNAMAQLQGHSEPETQADQQALLNRIEAAVSRLNERERRIYQLRFREEKPIAEIAAATGAPVGTIKSALFHMLKKLSSTLKPHIHE